ncbi:hypothetical protein ACKUB1_11865 [Methanospirillum stamsii]|uniref:hypothetical protein n=1 Tax=Methanospirillum stamsii TaxID=1277351 RepID=UPI0011B24E3A|nr:hypothetical protein [Methanospirillum stamsii]
MSSPGVISDAVGRAAISVSGDTANADEMKQERIRIVKIKNRRAGTGRLSGTIVFIMIPP